MPKKSENRGKTGLFEGISPLFEANPGAITGVSKVYRGLVEAIESPYRGK